MAQSFLFSGVVVARVPVTHIYWFVSWKDARRLTNRDYFSGQTLPVVSRLAVLVDVGLGVVSVEITDIHLAMVDLRKLVSDEI